MKRIIKSLSGFTMGATDGEIGKVKEFYFDDHTWTIRYLVVETGNWLSGRKVLISPSVLKTPDWEHEIFPVNLTKEQVKNSPEIDTDKPVSRQHETELYQHYGWDSYWGGGLWAGGLGTAGMMMPNPVPFDDAIREEASKSEDPANRKEQGDPNLRSTAAVLGYTIKAIDGDIGDVEDFVIDDTTWKITFMVVDTGNWLPGKKVLVSPRWIKEIRWQNDTVVIDATVEAVKNSPEYNSDEPLSDAYEKELHNHYHTVTY